MTLRNGDWAVIPEFPRYMISCEGEVLNQDSERLLKLSQNTQGIVKVGLVDDHHKQHTRSVKVLVAEAFVDGKTHQFDTPINLDGNQLNNRAVNLMWRPRAFALRWGRNHTRVSMGEEGNKAHYIFKPVYCMQEQTTHEHTYAASVFYGVEASEIFKSIHELCRTWPDGLMFRYVDDDRLGKIGTNNEYRHRHEWI